MFLFKQITKMILGIPIKANLKLLLGSVIGTCKTPPWANNVMCENY